MSDDVLAELEQLLGPQPRRQRYKLSAMKIRECSLVHAGACPGANVLLMKMHTPSELQESLIEKGGEDMSSQMFRTQESLGEVMISKSRHGGFQTKQDFYSALEDEIRRREDLPNNASVANQISEFLHTPIGKSMYEAYRILPDEDLEEVEKAAPDLTDTEAWLEKRSRELYSQPANGFQSKAAAYVHLLEADPGLYAKVMKERAER